MNLHRHSLQCLASSFRRPLPRIQLMRYVVACLSVTAFVLDELTIRVHADIRSSVVCAWPIC